MLRELFLGCVGGFESEGCGNFGARGRQTLLDQRFLDEMQHLALTRREVFHNDLPVFIYRYCSYIQLRQPDRKSRRRKKQAEYSQVTGPRPKKP